MATRKRIARNQQRAPKQGDWRPAWLRKAGADYMRWMIRQVGLLPELRGESVSL
jgi:hypothetical protein